MNLQSLGVTIWVVGSSVMGLLMAFVALRDWMKRAERHSKMLERCYLYNSGFTCTLPRGHEGPHVAELFQNYAAASWCGNQDLRVYIPRRPDEPITQEMYWHDGEQAYIVDKKAPARIALRKYKWNRDRRAL